jgi:hypothetical protein
MVRFRGGRLIFYQTRFTKKITENKKEIKSNENHQSTIINLQFFLRLLGAFVVNSEMRVNSVGFAPRNGATQHAPKIHLPNKIES